MNTIFIFNLQINNNCNNAKFVMEGSKDDMSSVLVESTRVFTYSSRIFTQSSELWAQSTKKSV
jgi:hypothetical protein